MQHGRSTAYTLHVHLVFVTKYRPVFTGEMLTACEHLMTDICTELGAQLVEFNGETDHVHLHVHYPPKLAISTLANRLKGVSSRRLRQQYPSHIRKYLRGQHFWSPSYPATSCRGAPMPIIETSPGRSLGAQTEVLSEARTHAAGSTPPTNEASHAVAASHPQLTYAPRLRLTRR